MVTGATGFLGRRLVPGLLEQGFSVTCLVRGDPGPGLWADCKMVEGDLNDVLAVKESLKGAEVVIHAGAVINPKNVEEFYSVNVAGTKLLVDEAVRAKVKHFIFISSVDVGTGTRYGRSKEEGERIVKSSGLDYTILRPGPIYGLGDEKNVMELMRVVQTKKIVPVIGDGNYLRQPIHIDDVIEGIIKVIGSMKSIGKTYFLGGPSLSYNELLGILVEASENRPTIVHLPAGLAKTLVMAVNKFGLGPNVTSDQISSLDKDKIGDIKAFEKDFKFKARGFREGISQVVQEMKGRPIQERPQRTAVFPKVENSGKLLRTPGFSRE